MSIWDKLLGPPPNHQDQVTITTTTTGTDPTTIPALDPAGKIPCTQLPIFTSNQVTLQNMLNSLGSLSQQDIEDLERLKTEHEHKVKSIKIEKFKKVNPALRQFVINSFEWEKVVKELNDVSEIQKAPRLTELEALESMSNMYSGKFKSQSSGLNMDGLFMSLFKGFTMPEGLSLEDLKKAHLDASLEEEILNDQKEN